MSPQQGQRPSHPARVPATLEWIVALTVQAAPDIAIAKSVDDILTPVDRRQQGGLGLGQRVERAMPATVLLDRPAHARRFLGHSAAKASA